MQIFAQCTSKIKNIRLYETNVFDDYYITLSRVQHDIIIII